MIIYTPFPSTALEVSALLNSLSSGRFSLTLTTAKKWNNPIMFFIFFNDEIGNAQRCSEPQLQRDFKIVLKH